jgi:hypothetical protein
MVTCPYSAGADFDQALAKAERLMEGGDVREALQLLFVLQDRFTRAARLFDMIAECLIREGRAGEGARYKSAHEALRGTLRLAGAGSSSAEVGRLRLPRREEPIVRDEVDDTRTSVPYHETPEMVRELLRQGHFEQALALVARLLEKRPEDRTLVELRDGARKKMEDRRVLEVLEKLLQKVKTYKGDPGSR